VTAAYAADYAADAADADAARGRPVVAVLGTGGRPCGLAAVEASAEVRYTTAERLPEDLRGADALLVWDFRSTAVEAAWPAAGALRWVHVAGAGVDAVLFPALRDSDVVLTNSRGVFEGPIAEYVLGLVLTFAKDLAGTFAAQRERRWQHRETERIDGAAVVIVGTGPIGRAVARTLRAVGMRVEGIGSARRDHDPDFGVVHGFDRLTRRLPHADFVVAAAPLTERTTGVFNASTLAAMKPSARLINVGRGGLVVTDDLVAALSDGVIAGAALDVFDTEPLPASSPLWSMPTVLVSPHMSGDFVGYLPVLAELFVDNYRRWRSGRPLRNVVDKKLGYVPSLASDG
jgi:phosphoglycerate dehydrogenase-like enzyme